MARRQIDQFDIDAERESVAIKSANKNRVHNPMLNKTYVCDGFRFPTGKKHRNVIQSAC